MGVRDEREGREGGRQEKSGGERTLGKGRRRAREGGQRRWCEGGGNLDFPLNIHDPVNVEVYGL